ncbi:MAG: DUF2865 domain-containing protein [Hyphomicrobiales bacterium]|nr:DUF2865 domain-containing protein [Hyphomicrobiales bacterium]
MTARSRSLTSPMLLGLLAVAAFVACAMPASAQGLLDFLFGSRRPGPPPATSAYVDPNPSFGGSAEERRTVAAGSVVFCVRLCDGRYFPIQRTGGASPAQLCSAFCPAGPARVFSGRSIDHAIASDGTRYMSLRTAFAFRERIVANCTCNGRDAHGLMPLSVTDDPTLRAGDIVATNEGFVAYHGGGHRNAEFTPIQSFPGLAAEWRERLAQTRIAPNNAAPALPQPGETAAPSERRVQLDR